MFEITTKEKINSSRYVNTIKSSLMTSEDGLDVLKLIINYIAKTSSNQSELRAIDEQTLENQHLMDSYLNKAIDSMIELASDEIKSYTTGELSKYFGVSITAINKWIDQGRFVGIERVERNKQLRIPENTLWKSRNGKSILVKEIVDTYEEENFSEEERIDAIKETIKFFEEKYGGSFEAVFRGKENMSAEDEANFREWKYLLSEIN